MSAKFPCVSKRPVVPGIIDLPKFNHEDLEEIVADGQGSFGNASRYIHTVRTTPMPLLLLFIPYKFFSSHDDKVQNNERKRKRGGHCKTAATKRLNLFLSVKAYVKRFDVAYF